MMMLFVLHQLLARPYCISNLAGAIAAISGQVQQNPLTIEIDTTDALAPQLNSNFPKPPATEKFRCCKNCSASTSLLHASFFPTKKDCQAVCYALNAGAKRTFTAWRS
ncbi:hypothetical protein ACNKHK_11615 [Shigella flexneri]